MITELFLAFLQAATEFLPVSSSGHLALFSNLLSQPNLFFFTVLHVASLLAVIIYTRREIALLLTFNQQARRLWSFLIIATIPAALFGYFFHNIIGSAFSSYLALAIGFFLTGSILLATKNFSGNTKHLDKKNSLFIGLLQVLALFPGVSRSGMTISAGLFSGVNKEQAARFSFLLFIPLSIGALFLELGNAYINTTLIISFVLTFIASLVFLHVLTLIIQKEKFWMFSIYCYLLALISLLLYLF